MMSSEKLFYFNPRLREGGDPVVCPCPNAVCISIHASAKEATRNNPFRFCLFETISIHASAKEATKYYLSTMGRNLLFQSTPPRRRRPFFGTGTIGILLISIHASAKEATDTTSDNVYTFVISIHASAKEATSNSEMPAPMSLFQSTPPRRRRPQHIVILQLSCTYLVSTTFLSTIFSFISQYVVLFFLF